MKEAYIREETIREKSLGWMEALAPFNRGKGRFKLDADRSALLVIDMQRFFLDPGSHAFLPAGPAVLPNVQRLVSAFKARGRAVVYTLHAYAKNEDPGIMGRWWNDVLMAHDPLAGIEPALEPGPADLVVRKTLYSAFRDTPLLPFLREKEVEQVVITGVLSHLCCDSTARDAFMNGFEVFFAADATAAPTEQLHLGALRALADGFAVLVLSDEILAGFQEVRDG